MDVPPRREEQKMLAGAAYNASDPELVAKRAWAYELTRRLNAGETDVLYDLLGGVGGHVEIVPPFFCDYGANIFVGSDIYINTGCVILDCGRVELGDRVLLGPGVHLYAATHPVDPVERRSGLEYGAPLTVGSDVWIGGGAVICPGVTIGAGTTIGAGSVVVRDIPANVVAAGNPCRVIRSITLACRV